MAENLFRMVTTLFLLSLLRSTLRYLRRVGNCSLMSLNTCIDSNHQAQKRDSNYINGNGNWIQKTRHPMLNLTFFDSSVISSWVCTALWNNVLSAEKCLFSRCSDLWTSCSLSQFDSSIRVSVKDPDPDSNKNLLSEKRYWSRFLTGVTNMLVRGNGLMSVFVLTSL